MTTANRRLLAALVPVSTEPEAESKPTDLNTDKGQSPTLGDSLFYTYCVPGSVFQDKKGDYWDIENIADTGYVRIRNKWIPRQEVTLLMADLRKVIRAWVEPIQQIVPELVVQDAK